MSDLTSRRVVVTRPVAQSGEICGLLEGAGAVPVLVPTIAIAAPSSFEPLDRALRSGEAYDWIVFTSANGVRSVLERLADLGLEPPYLAGLRLAAVGPATRRVLTDAGLSVAAMPTDSGADAIPEALGDVRGVRILLPRSDLADATLPESLRARGARVDAVAAYVCVTRPLTNANLEALAAGVDAFTFASPSAIRGLLEGGSPDVTSALEQGVVATIGPVTSEAARVLGVRVDVEAVESTSRGLVEALCTYQGWALQSPSPAPP